MYPTASTSRPSLPPAVPPLAQTEPTTPSSAVIVRGTDILTTMKVNLNLGASAESIARAASDAVPELPRYRPDGAGVILVFHTDSGCHVLGGERENRALRDLKTSDGSAFPPQITMTLGGTLSDPERSLKDSLIDAAKRRLLLEVPTAAQGDVDLATLNRLADAVASPDGWETQVCIHTDKWRNRQGGESTMCYLTGVKHLQCSDDEFALISKALDSSTEARRTHGSSQTLMAFRFASLDAMVANASATYAMNEKDKAEHAWQQFGNQVAVTFNDLAVATLAGNGGLAKDHSAARI